MLHEVAHGLDIYYNQRENVVFFADGRVLHCKIGDMLLELNREEAFYMMTEKAHNLIQVFPDYNEPLDLNTLTNGFKWVYGAIEEEEDLPFTTELFRSDFNAAINELLQQDANKYACIGDFLIGCSNLILSRLEAFAIYMSAIVRHNSKTVDNE